MLFQPCLPETRKQRDGRRACYLAIFGLRHGSEPGYQRYTFLTSHLDCAFCSPTDKVGLFCSKSDANIRRVALRMLISCSRQL